MADLRKHSSTSNIVRFILKHSTTGQGLTGLTNASSGLIISTICDNESSATSYTVAGSKVETISTLGTFATPTSTKCRFKEVDSTNHPGLYEFQFDNTRFSVSSAKRLVISVSGATNLLNADYEIQLTIIDVYSAQIIRKNVATSNFPFYLVSSTDHVTPVTGATVTATRSIDGGSFASCTNSASEVGSGTYKINLSASDLNGDIVAFKFSATGADVRTMYVLPVS